MDTRPSPSPTLPVHPRHPGAMSATMRAARAPDAERVLRVAVLAGGHVVEERVVPRGTRVTAGTREDCTFVLPAPAPERVALLVPVKNGWELRVPPGTRGRVATGEQVVELGPARVEKLALEGDARGRVVLGASTLLFQLAPRPPAAPRPRLPLAVKQGLLGQVDWTLTVLVALSFLMHFGLVGGMYSDWMDPTVDTDVTARLLLPPAALPPPPVESQDAAEPSAPAAQAGADARPAPSVQRPPRPAPGPQPPHADDPGALLHEWEQLTVVAIGVTGPGGNLRRVLQQGDDAPPLDLGSFHGEHVGDRSIALDLPHASDPIRPGTREGDLTQLRPGETAPVASTAGRVRTVVPFSMQPEPARTSARIANLEAVVHGQLEPRARACFQRAVNADPTLPDGSVLVSMQVAPSGEVASTSVTRTGLSQQVASCISAAAQRLVFDPPGGAGASVTVPMHFVKQ